MSEGVLFIAALGWEARSIIKQIKVLERRDAPEGTLWRGLVKGREVSVLQSGIGPRSAEKAISWASEIFLPAVVVVTGCAGALVSGLQTGELVVAEEVVTPPDPPRATSAEWIERYRRASLATGLRARCGRILASPSVLMSVEEKKRAARDARAIAVAMEDGAVGAWAAARGVALASVRVILDPLEMVIPREVSSITGPSGKPLPNRVLRAIVRRPGVIADFLKLGSAQRVCRRTLEVVHRFVLEGPRPS